MEQMRVVVKKIVNEIVGEFLYQVRTDRKGHSDVPHAAQRERLEFRLPDQACSMFETIPSLFVPDDDVWAFGLIRHGKHRSHRRMKLIAGTRKSNVLVVSKISRIPVRQADQASF